MKNKMEHLHKVREEKNWFIPQIVYKTEYILDG